MILSKLLDEYEYNRYKPFRENPIIILCCILLIIIVFVINQYNIAKITYT